MITQHPDYAHLTDDELLHIAEARDQLTDEARTVLDSELATRRLSASDVGLYTTNREAAEKVDQLERAKTTYSFHTGLAKKFLGKTNRRRDPSGAFEEYESTLWFVVLLFPVFPIATFTVRRPLKRQLGFEWAGSEVAIERHPRNWEQILLTWVEASAVVLALRIGFLLLEHPPNWLKSM